MLKIRTGNSGVDRIGYFTKNEGATAIQKEDGTIEIEYGKNNDLTMKGIVIFLGVFTVISIIKSVVVMPRIVNGNISVLWYLFPAIFYTAITVAAVKLFRESEERRRNHGAEHMVFLAYEKLERVPTVSEAQRSSRINKECGVTMFTMFITLQLIGFFVYITTGFVINEVILVVAPLLLQQVFPFNILGLLTQFLTTSRPEIRNIELAIEAMMALEKKLLGEVGETDVSDSSK